MPRASGFWGLCLLLGIGVAAGVALAPPARPQPSLLAQVQSSPLQPAYVGSAACAECHATQVSDHQTSGHAHTFFHEGLCRSSSTLLNRDIPDPERGGTFRFTCEKEALVASYTQDGVTSKMPIQFALGSGTHATTFLTFLPSTGETPLELEHRLTFYAATGDVGLTPSHAGATVQRPEEQFGRLKSNPGPNCISCHTTTAVVRGTTVDDLRPHVGCESCHGPGRNHVNAVRSGAGNFQLEFGPSNSTAADEVALCGRCHRSLEGLVVAADPDDRGLARFQPIGLRQSACYRESPDRLRCTTCHDPHRTVDHNPDSYIAECGRCHSQPQQTHCSAEPEGNCIECHMPRVEVHPGIFFRDHWIRRREAK